MAKELLFYRFYVSKWLTDDISFETYKTKGVFSDVCAFYWSRDCTVTKEILLKRFKNAKSTVNELISKGLIKETKNNDLVNIKFLDEQHDILSNERQKKVDAGRIGGMAKGKHILSDD